MRHFGNQQSTTAATAITPIHSRTGSSPAVIQNPVLAQQSGNPATRWEMSAILTNAQFLTHKSTYLEPTHIRRSLNAIVWGAPMEHHQCCSLPLKVPQRQTRHEACRFMDNQRRHHCSQKKCHQIIIWTIAITTRLTITTKMERSRTRRKKWFISDISQPKLRFKIFSSLKCSYQMKKIFTTLTLHFTFPYRLKVSVLGVV